MTDINSVQASLQQPAVPDQIREQVIEYLGIQYAPKEKQDEVLAKLGEVAFQKIIFAVLERLDEKGQAEYDALLAREASPDEMEEFFKTFVPEYESVVSGAVDDLMKKLKSVEA